MKRDLPDFIGAFDTIGYFLIKLNELLKQRPQIAAELGELAKGKSPSLAEEALDAWNTIVDTVYGTSRNCPSGSPKMR